jgi:hypothetical protein
MQIFWRRQKRKRRRRGTIFLAHTLLVFKRYRDNRHTINTHIYIGFLL